MAGWLAGWLSPSLKLLSLLGSAWLSVYFPLSQGERGARKGRRREGERTREKDRWRETERDRERERETETARDRERQRQ